MLGTTNCCYTQIKILKLLTSWFQRRRFFTFSYCKSTGDHDPRGVANLDPRSMIGRNLLLHTKYKSSGPHGLREEDFFIFSYCMTMGDDNPRVVANLDPRGRIGRLYVEYHLTLLHTKYTSFRPCGFREEDF